LALAGKRLLARGLLAIDCDIRKFLGVKAVSSGGTDACSGTRTITTLFSNRDDCVAPACWAAIKQGTSTVVTLHGLFDQKRREGRAQVRSSSDSRTVVRHERVAHYFDILGFRGIPSGAYPRLDVLGRKIAELSLPSVTAL